MYSVYKQKKKVKRHLYTIGSKRIKYSEISFTKVVQKLYFANYKTLLREIKDN